MLRDKLESELQSRIVQVKDQSREINLLGQNQAEFQKLAVRATEPDNASEPSKHDVEAYRLKLHQQVLALQAERHAWQCELAEKQLLLQTRNAEIEQHKSEIASLTKRVRELELISQQTPATISATAQPQNKGGALSEMRTTAIRDGQGASVRGIEKACPTNWDPRDDDFVMGEPKLTAAQEISFTHSADEKPAADADTEKSPKFFRSRRWRIRGHKRRWRIKDENHTE